MTYIGQRIRKTHTVIKMKEQNASMTIIEQLSWRKCMMYFQMCVCLLYTKCFDLKSRSLLMIRIIRGGSMEEVGLKGTLKGVDQGHVS